MNRIVLIGNGFDLAHGLETSYTNFIDNYWTTVSPQIFNGYILWLKEHYGSLNAPKAYSDDFISLKIWNYKKETNKDFFNPYGKTPFCNLCMLIEEYNSNSEYTAELIFKNKFLAHLTNKCSVMDWVDVENEYYELLKMFLTSTLKSALHNRFGWSSVKELNNEFGQVKGQLENYLTQSINYSEIKKYSSIEDAFSSQIELRDIAHSKKKMFYDSIMECFIRFDNMPEFLSDKETDSTYSLCLTKEEEHEYFINKRLKNERFKEIYCIPTQTLILNFNYTKTAEQLYAKPDYEVINIHGELNSKTNPIIFGYGDELDDNYKEIEKVQDNDLLENIKSIKYHKTRNYRNLLSFLGSEPYQVFIMGHSCGNSDRTLLNTIFEHKNCTSVKVFYRQYEDGADDHENLIRNISRNFNDKLQMRDIVVNWEDCSPLVPTSKKQHI